MARSTARETVMQLFYEKSLGGDGGEISQDMILEQINQGEQKPIKLTKADQLYISRVVEGLAPRLEELDTLISQTAVSWEIDRIGKVDLAILRLAIYELLYEPNTPASVVINEAVVLGNRYSQPASGKFINGILATVLNTTEKESLVKSENPQE
ncbi:MAG: transcription antitermination factor NusB [Clostridiales bacterium]|nr:transcription antitermination factor NusB [Clostridiales bacterium]